MASRYYSGPTSDHFDGTRFFIPGFNSDKSQSDLLKWTFGEKRAAWPASFPSPHGGAVPAARVDGLRSTLIGHASFLVQVAGLNILVDPVFSERASPFQFAGPKRVNAPGVAFGALPAIDAVLITHNHYDHMDMAALTRLAASHPQARAICPLGVDTILGSAWHGRCTALDWGQATALGAASVHAVPTFHWSARGLRDRRMSLWCSFVITSPAGTLYHIGDTGYGDGRFSRAVARDFGPVALAHIPIGAYAPRWFMKDHHVHPDEAVQVFQDCAAARAIGHHWGTFQLTNESIEEPAQLLAQAVAKAGIAPDRFIAFRPGQTLDVARSAAGHAGEEV